MRLFTEGCGVLVAVTSLTLVACGGGSDGNGSGGDGTNKASKAAAMLFGAQNRDHGDNFDAAQNKAAKIRQKNANLKSTDGYQECDTGQYRISFEGNTTTYEYEQCAFSGFYADGVIVEVCATEACNSVTMTFGANGGDYLERFDDESGGTITDRLSGSEQLSYSGDGEDFEFSSTTNTLKLASTYSNGDSTAIDYNDWSFTATGTDSSESEVLTLDGTLKFSDTRSECFSGTVVMETLEDLVTSNDEEGDLVDGRLQLQVGSDVTVLEFNANGTVSVTVNGQDEGTVSSDNFEKGCL